METLRYVVEEYPATAENGEIVDGWIVIRVSYEIGSMDPYTEEDRINDEKRLQEAQARREEDEKQYGEKAMQALEEEMQHGGQGNQAGDQD